MVDTCGQEDWDAYGNEEDMDWEPSQNAEVKPAVKVLSMAEIRPNVESKLQEFCDLFGLSLDHMLLLAKHFSWNEEKM